MIFPIKFFQGKQAIIEPRFASVDKVEYDYITFIFIDFSFISFWDISFMMQPIEAKHIISNREFIDVPLADFIENILFAKLNDVVVLGGIEVG